MRTPKASIAAVAALVSVLFSCDSTVGLDPTRPTFTELLVPGACIVEDNLSQVDLSVMLLDVSNQSIQPDALLAREFQPVGELLSINNFEFSRPATAGQDFPEDAFVEGEAEPAQKGVAVNPISLEFKWTGGIERKDDSKLVVLAMDHSGSLAGQDPRTLLFDISRASDRSGEGSDQRIVFFQQLVADLEEREKESDENFFMSLISFNGSFANVREEYATPTLNKDIIRDGLTALSRDEEGLTPLADGLKAALERVITAGGNEDLNPIVVLFTDGVERAADGSSGGDTSTSSLYDGGDGTAGMIRRYSELNIPVIVLHLQSAVNSGFERGRDRALMDLACQTGGEYIFLERADEFTKSDSLSIVVKNRISGIWRLRTETTLGQAAFGSDNYLLSTEVSATLSGREESARVARSETNLDYEDSRLWFYK